MFPTDYTQLTVRDIARAPAAQPRASKIWILFNQLIMQASKDPQTQRSIRATTTDLFSPFWEGAFGIHMACVDARLLGAKCSGQTIWLQRHSANERRTPNELAQYKKEQLCEIKNLINTACVHLEAVSTRPVKRILKELKAFKQVIDDEAFFVLSPMSLAFIQDQSPLEEFAPPLAALQDVFPKVIVSRMVAAGQDEMTGEYRRFVKETPRKLRVIKDLLQQMNDLEKKGGRDNLKQVLKLIPRYVNSFNELNQSLMDFKTRCSRHFEEIGRGGDGLLKCAWQNVTSLVCGFLAAQIVVSVEVAYAQQRLLVAGRILLVSLVRNVAANFISRFPAMEKAFRNVVILNLKAPGEKNSLYYNTASIIFSDLKRTKGEIESFLNQELDQSTGADLAALMYMQLFGGMTTRISEVVQSPEFGQYKFGSIEESCLHFYAVVAMELAVLMDCLMAPQRAFVEEEDLEIEPELPLSVKPSLTTRETPPSLPQETESISINACLERLINERQSKKALPSQDSKAYHTALRDVIRSCRSLLELAKSQNRGLAANYQILDGTRRLLQGLLKASLAKFQTIPESVLENHNLNESFELLLLAGQQTRIPQGIYDLIRQYEELCCRMAHANDILHYGAVPKDRWSIELKNLVDQIDREEAVESLIQEQYLRPGLRFAMALLDAFSKPIDSPFEPLSLPPFASDWLNINREEKIESESLSLDESPPQTIVPARVSIVSRGEAQHAVCQMVELAQIHKNRVVGPRQVRFDQHLVVVIRTLNQLRSRLERESTGFYDTCETLHLGLRALREWHVTVLWYLPAYSGRTHVLKCRLGKRSLERTDDLLKLNRVLHRHHPDKDQLVSLAPHLWMKKGHKSLNNWTVHSKKSWELVQAMKALHQNGQRALFELKYLFPTLEILYSLIHLGMRREDKKS